MKGNLLYEGKAKKIFESRERKDELVVEFKNSLTAFNNIKKGSFDSKGEVNAQITALIYTYLGKLGIQHHLVKAVGPNVHLVKKVKIIPFEVVVRNVMAGSLAKKLAQPEGASLPEPLVEFYLKDDALGDPFMSSEQIVGLKMESLSTLKDLTRTALEINQYMIEAWKRVGLRLVDMKLEFGRTEEGSLLLADEITPDTCRLWDIETNEKFDKDRFRHDLGNIEGHYQEVLARLQKGLNQ